MIANTTLSQAGFATEAIAWDWFDEMVERTGAFRVHKEVKGYYIQPRAQTEEKDARIDRILTPQKRILELGWADGCIGVEGKASNVKAGRVISQALDYTRCVFRLNEYAPGLLLMPTWIFIYPFENPYGDLESVMAQNRIGYAKANKWSGKETLEFSCSGQNAIFIDGNGALTCQHLPMGFKRGSR